MKNFNVMTIEWTRVGEGQPAEHFKTNHTFTRGQVEGLKMDLSEFDAFFDTEEEAAGDLAELSEDDLLKCYSVGSAKVTQVKAAMSRLGLSLANSPAGLE